MGAWVKYFQNGSSEIGSDLNIQAEKASWSNGKLKDIYKVQLSEGVRSVILKVCDTEWYQFDRFISFLENTNEIKPTRSARVIQAKVQKSHKDQYVTYSNQSACEWVIVQDDIEENGILIKQEHINQWITVVLFANGKIDICFSDKGKYQWGQVSI